MKNMQKKQEVDGLYYRDKMKDSNIINGNCWLACFDILGFKKRILGFEKANRVGTLDRFANVIYKEGRVGLAPPTSKMVCNAHPTFSVNSVPSVAKNKKEGYVER